METESNDHGDVVETGETEKPMEADAMGKLGKPEKLEVEKLKEALKQEKAKNRDYLRQLAELKEV